MLAAEVAEGAEAEAETRDLYHANFKKRGNVHKDALRGCLKFLVQHKLYDRVSSF